MRSTLASTVESIGWHQHGRSWVWGVRPNDGCALCDAIDAWLCTQVDWRDEVAAELRTRIAVREAETIRFGSDPHTPQPVSEADALSVEKIQKRSKTKVVEQQPAPTLFQAKETSIFHMVPDNETDDVPPPPPPPMPTFQLTNPTEHTITKTGKRKRR